MATTVEQILQSFEALPETDQQRLVIELLRRSANTPLSDDELVGAADEVFQGYDREERERE